MEQVSSYFKSGKNIPSSKIESTGIYPVYGGNGLRGYTKEFNHTGLSILIGRQGALCGNVKIVDGKYYATEHAIVVKNNQYADLYYLAYLLMSMHLERESDQSAQPGLAVNKIIQLKAMFPPIDEQQKIGMFLHILDERIQTQNKIIKDLKIQKAKIRQTEILNVSTNRILVLNQLCNIKTGKKDANQMKSNGTYKFFTCSREDYYIDTYSFEGDSLIISGNGEIGLIKYYSGKFDAYQRTYVLQNFECDPLYLKLVLEEKLPKIINKEKNVGAMPYIVLSTLSNITIPLPDLQTQTKIQINIGVLDKKIKIESQLLNKFEIQKKFLLNNMFI